MTLSASWRTRALRTVVGLVAALSLAAPASASVVAYIDGGEVWVSSLDGTGKARLSTGEGNWLDVAASDGGRIAGAQNDPGKISSFSFFRVWEPNGKLAHFGALSAPPGWSIYVYPLGFDISADGLFLAYGFSNTRLSGTGYQFDSGYYARGVANASLEPIRVPGEEWPTLFGRRVISEVNHWVRVQDPLGAPFEPNFVDWFDTSVIADTQLHRTDVAANGSLAALELVAPAVGPTTHEAVLVESVASLGGALTSVVDCFLPAVGRATSVSISQDATRIAWKDDEGVKVAGAPSGTAEFCTLASPPVIISPTGKHPSIGGGAIDGFLPNITVTVPSKLSVAALAAKGVSIKVTVPLAGKVSCAGTVPASRLGRKGSKRVVVATCAATATQAGTVTVKLRLNSVGRKAASRLRGGKLTLKVTQGSKSFTKTVTLR